MFAAVLFDLDGTLIDTAPEIGQALNITLSELDLDAADAQEVRSWIGHGTRNLIREALVSRQGPDGPIQLEVAMQRFKRNYRHVCGQVGELYPGVKETLEALHARQVPMGLLSNKETEFGQMLLRQHRLSGFFSVTTFGDTLPAKKPSAEPVKHCMQMLRKLPYDVLLVGDSEIDVATARNAEIAVWAVSYGYHQKGHARDLGADRTIGTLVDLLSHLRSTRPIWADRARAGAE
jgi:phosphoglycolate phosphatase